MATCCRPVSLDHFKVLTFSYSLTVMIQLLLLSFRRDEETLLETAYMPSARCFAECQTTGTRQTTSLPSAEPQALGKASAHGTFLFCRVPALGKSPALGIPSLC